MVLDTTTFVYVLLFIGVLLLFEGIVFLVRDLRQGHDRIVNARLRVAAGVSDARAVLRKMRREDQGSISNVLNRAVPYLDRSISQSGLQISTLRLVIVMIGLTVLMLAFLRLVTVMLLWQVVPIALAIGIGLPFLVIYVMRRKRLKAFSEQLPEALDILSKSLRAGHPISAAFNLVAQEMPDPIGSEIGIVIDEMTYGYDMDQALQNLAHRVPQEDLQFFVVSVNVQRTTGGNLAEVLSNLSQVIRDRIRMFAKIRAVSAEGRWSGNIISCIPFLLIAWLNFIVPSFLGDVSGDPVFVPAMVTAAVLLVVGLIWIYKMVNFRV